MRKLTTTNLEVQIADPTWSAQQWANKVSELAGELGKVEALRAETTEKLKAPKSAEDLEDLLDLSAVLAGDEDRIRQFIRISKERGLAAMQIEDGAKKAESAEAARVIFAEARNTAARIDGLLQEAAKAFAELRDSHLRVRALGVPGGHLRFFARRSLTSNRAALAAGLADFMVLQGGMPLPLVKFFDLESPVVDGDPVRTFERPTNNPAEPEFHKGMRRMGTSAYLRSVNERRKKLHGDLGEDTRPEPLAS